MAPQTIHLATKCGHPLYPPAVCGLDLSKSALEHTPLCQSCILKEARQKATAARLYFNELGGNNGERSAEWNRARLSCRLAEARWYRAIKKHQRWESRVAKWEARSSLPSPVLSISDADMVFPLSSEIRLHSSSSDEEPPSQHVSTPTKKPTKEPRLDSAVPGIPPSPLKTPPNIPTKASPEVLHILHMKRLEKRKDVIERLERSSRQKYQLREVNNWDNWPIFAKLLGEDLAHWHWRWKLRYCDGRTPPLVKEPEWPVPNHLRKKVQYHKDIPKAKWHPPRKHVQNADDITPEEATAASEANQAAEMTAEAGRLNRDVQYLYFVGRKTMPRHLEIADELEELERIVKDEKSSSSDSSSDEQSSESLSDEGSDEDEEDCGPDLPQFPSARSRDDDLDVQTREDGDTLLRADVD